MYNSKLFAILPDYIVTPDGMEVDRHGNLVLSCPNFADDSVPGVVVRFDKDRNISKWFEVPVHPEIGVARNMGICFDEDDNIYLVDNPGWKADRPDWANKGRILKVTVNDDGNIDLKDASQIRRYILTGEGFVSSKDDSWIDADY